MHIIGIIGEYNPFHNGHIYHINKIKEKYPDSLIILVLNGYFMQRGDISFISKKNKTIIALENQIDIVLELPAIFGTQSADYFAYNAIAILNEFKVDRIIFGSESNNIDILKEIATKQMDKNYNKLVKEYLNSGINYPTALAKALNISFDFNKPNDLLGISYIKAVLSINPNIMCETIKRTNSYHDIESDNSVISASNIRNKIKQNKDISNYLPNESIENIENIDDDLYFKILKYKINTTTNLKEFLDVEEGIENRLIKHINTSSNINDFVNNIKTKRYTFNKINRMILHILLDFKKESNIKYLEYIKILGFNNKGKDYINKIKKDIKIPLKPIINSNTYKIEYKATLLYDMLTNKQNIDFENRNKPIII